MSAELNPYDLGKWAFEGGIPVTENPFEYGTGRWQAWRDGWADADYWETEFH